MKLLLSYWALLGTVTALEEFLTSESQQLLSCVETLLNRQLPPGHSLVVSLPTDERISNHRTLAPRDHHAIYFELIETMLKNVNTKTIWPVFISRPTTPVSENLIPHKHHMYIIFLCPNADENIGVTLESHVRNLTEFLESFNRRGKFVVVASGYEEFSPTYYAKEIIDIMWKGNKLTNVLVIIPNKHTSAPKSNLLSGNDTEQSPGFYVYTWSAYESGQCGEVEEVFLIDEWVVNETKGRFRKNMTHFPSKFPQNVHGCPITVSTVHFPPSVIMTENNTDVNNIKYRGIEIEYLHLLSKDMNMTLEFRTPPEGKLEDRFYKAFSEAVLEGVSDIAIGCLWIHPVMIYYGEPTIPYMFSRIKWFVPCPQPTPRVQKIKEMFAPSVFILMALVLILTSVLFWSTARVPNCVSWCDCLQSAWAIFLSMSVPKLPGSSLIRAVFLIYVWYSFLINSVFISFFISFLANPGHEAQIKTMKELAESRLTVYIPDLMNKIFVFTSYKTYFELKLPIKTAETFHESFRRLIDENDVATAGLQMLAEYFAASEGKFGKYGHLCSIDETISFARVTMYFAKGNPLLNRANVVLRRCFESGLVKKYSSELMLNTRLKSSAKLLECENMEICKGGHTYFVFTLDHMKYSFTILLVGYSLSFVVFFAELICKYYSKSVVNT